MSLTLEKKIYDMGQGDHACLIYDSLPEQMAAVLPFIKAGIERNEACLYVANDRPITEIRQIFLSNGISVDREIERGALIFAENTIPEGKFEPKEMVGVLRNFTQEAIQKGFKGFRGLGEMSWVIGNECACDQLIEYEALLNETFPSHLTGMCQYNRARFKPETIRDILRTHSVVVIGDAVCRNLYCEVTKWFEARSQKIWVWAGCLITWLSFTSLNNSFGSSSKLGMILLQSRVMN